MKLTDLTKPEKQKLYRQIVTRYQRKHGRRPNRATARRQMKTYLELHTQEENHVLGK